MAKKLGSYFVIQVTEHEGVPWFWGVPTGQDRFTKTNDVNTAIHWQHESQASLALKENSRHLPGAEVKEVVMALR